MLDYGQVAPLQHNKYIVSPSPHPPRRFNSLELPLSSLILELLLWIKTRPARQVKVNMY
jgi:hypothetical protein